MFLLSPPLSPSRFTLHSFASLFAFFQTFLLVFRTLLPSFFSPFSLSHKCPHINQPYCVNTKMKKISKITNSKQITEETQTRRPEPTSGSTCTPPPPRPNEGNHRRQTAREGRHDTSITNSHNRNVQQRQTAAQHERLAAITAPAAGA